MESNKRAAAKAPLNVGDEITAFIDLTSAQITLVCPQHGQYRVVVLDCYARPLRPSENFTDEADARTYARSLTQELRMVRCKRSPITTRVHRA